MFLDRLDCHHFTRTNKQHVMQSHWNLLVASGQLGKSCSASLFPQTYASSTSQGKKTAGNFIVMSPQQADPLRSS